MCDVVRGHQICGKRKTVGSKMCSYHFNGGTMLSRTHYYSIICHFWKDTFTGSKPEKGDLRYDHDSIYCYDSKNWRRQCLTCDRVARPVYCKSCYTPLPNRQLISIEPLKKSGTCGVSLLACRFIDLLEKEWDTSILHKHLSYNDGFQTMGSNGNEFMIPSTRYRVDGIVSGTNIVVEVLGDFWHGNPKVYDHSKVNKTVGKTYGELFMHTFERLTNIKNMGYKVVYVWEKDINELYNSNVSVLSNNNNCKICIPIGSIIKTH